MVSVRTPTAFRVGGASRNRTPAYGFGDHFVAMAYAPWGGVQGVSCSQMPSKYSPLVIILRAVRVRRVEESNPYPCGYPEVQTQLPTIQRYSPDRGHLSIVKRLPRKVRLERVELPCFLSSHPDLQSGATKPYSPQTHILLLGLFRLGYR